MTKILFTAVSAVLIAAPLEAQCAGGNTGSYTVVLDSATRDFADVDAVLSVPDGKLRMSTGASDHLPEH